MQNNTHILVIRLSAMGDVAMTVPIIKNFVAQYPDIKITFLSKAFLKPLFDDIDNVTFYTADVEKQHKGIIGLYRLYKDLKKENISHIADLHNVLRSKILRSFFKFSIKKIAHIDKGRKEKKALTRSQNKVFKQLKTTHQRYADVFTKLGFELNINKPITINIPQLSATVLKITGQKNNTWIGIAPFAQYQSKTYPLDLMEKIIANLSQKHTIFLFGGGNKEIETLTNIAKKFPQSICVAGKLDLKDELNLIAQLDVMLAMDSGNAHFAAMQQVPTVTLWGATHPFAGFAPYFQPKENCILPDLKKFPNIPCSVYGNTICDGYEEVMRSILPDQVIQRINKIIS